MKKQLLVSFLILIFLLVGTVGVVLYGKGYRLDFNGNKPGVSKTGLLVTTSLPDGAQVFINDNLTTATDNTIDLAPGEYDITIKKEGYFEWKKRLTVQEELVTKADALLYPLAPKLESITTTGVETPVLDPAGTKIAFRVASQSAVRNGVYIYDMNARSVLSLQTAAKQLANDTSALFSTANISWSPDGDSILATISGELGDATYLLDANQLNEAPRNITATLPSFQEQFEAEKAEKIEAQIAGLRPALKSVINKYFDIVSWSPDDTKVLYAASSSGQLPLIITPRLVGIDTMREVRDIKAGSIYVYDLKEDRNTLIMDVIPEDCKIDESVQSDGIQEQSCTSKQSEIKWFPDSEHLVYVKDKQIHMIEFDGTNDTVIYAGPFINEFVFPWPDRSRVVVLTNLNNPSILPNLYTISLK